jgi:hypothetical protein
VTRLAHFAIAWSASMAVLTGSIYAEAVARRIRARKRTKPARRHLAVIDGGGATVIQLRPTQVRHG